MNNPSDGLTKNKFVDKFLNILPDNPVTHSLYMYWLTAIIFLGLLGFSVMSWREVMFSFNGMALFRSIFMTAISISVLFGLKQVRLAYHTTKELMSQPKQEMKVESFNEMIEGFK